MSDWKKDENLQNKIESETSEGIENINTNASVENQNSEEQLKGKLTEQINQETEQSVETEQTTGSEQKIETEQTTEAEQSEKGEQAAEADQTFDSEKEATPKIKLGAKIKESFHNRKFRSGAYTTVISTVVIVIVLVVNIFLSKFDLKLDLSTNALFTLTDATKDYVATIDDDITIYYLVQAGNEYDYYVNLAEKYDALSDHITLEYKDPVLYPKFASDYTDATVTENSVIVVNNTNGRYKYIDYSDMKETQVDYSTYSQYDSGIDFEGQVTSALQYVTNEELPVFYQVTGHGETEVGTSFSDLLTKQNVDVQTLATTKSESVPEDCQVLLINAPKTDYTEEEITMIKDYLVNGGKALIFTDYYTNDCPNFTSLLNYYGIEIVDGYIMEGDYDHMAYQYAPYVIPDVDTSVDLLANYSSTGSFLVSPFSVGIKALDTVRSSITMQSFLTTSDQSYSKVNLQSDTISKEDGDVDGPFDLGVAITETYNGVETNLVVMGCPMIADDSILSSASYANYDLISSIVNYVSDSEVEAVSVPIKSLQASSLTLTSSQQNFWFYTAFIIIPVIVLVLGGVVVVRRRKK